MKIHLNYPKCPIGNNPALVQITAWHRIGESTNSLFETVANKLYWMLPNVLLDWPTYQEIHMDGFICQAKF